MCIENLKLIEPTISLKQEFLTMVEEHLKFDANPEAWDFKEAGGDFEAYIKKLTDYSKGENLPEGLVPASNYWLVGKNNLVIGSSGLRHRLTPNLRRYGGHIGYYIRPSQRQKGHGMRILSLALEKAKELGLKRVLVTCDDDNIASAKIIEVNGGVLGDKIMNEGHKAPTRRYWIDLIREET